MTLLERRLDNVVHRLGFGLSRARPASWLRTATSRSTATACDIPSYLVRVGDVIRVKNRAKSLDLAAAHMAENSRDVPDFLSRQRVGNSRGHRQPLARGR